LKLRGLGRGDPNGSPVSVKGDPLGSPLLPVHELLDRKHKVINPDNSL